jgi:DNA mismatch endonuclease (patch repair protein)
MKISRARVTEQMRRIQSKNTAPELVVRGLVRVLGFKYRLHGADLPGTPDLVFPDEKKVIFIHGCFWHLHHNCRLARMPRRNLSYWGPKLLGNKARDRRDKCALTRSGWEYLVLWECESKDTRATVGKIRRYLES